MLLFLVLIISCIGKTFSESPQYIWKSCQEESYSSGSVFDANLNKTLFTQLLPKAETVKFSNNNTGTGEDQVYGLFYCKGDVDAQTCLDCVDAATRKIKDECNLSKEGIVWYEECTLRYANRNFFSSSEEKPNYPYNNVSGKVTDALLDPYKDIFITKMNALIQEAPYIKGDLPCFTTEEVSLSSSEVIRGIAQCTPDIAGPECSRCLKTAFKLVDLWGNTIMLLPSCFFRYDYYEIGPVLATAPVDSDKSPSLGVPLLVLVVVLPVVLIVLAVMFGPRLWKCCSGSSPGPLPPPTPIGLRRYTFSEVERMTNNFGRELGRGGFGVVFHGRLLDGSREVAVKRLNQNDAPNQFSNEINVFVQISHNNLVSLLGYCDEVTNLALIYEYMDNGDLKALLSENGNSLSWTDRLKIAIDIAEGLHYLHRNCEVRIVHRDVKPANILLNQNLRAKVADFGLSKIFTEQDPTTILTRVIGTYGYKAPEYDTTGLLNEKVDVYSYGVILMELITGLTPRRGFNLVGWFINEINTGSIEEVLDARMTQGAEQINQVPDSVSVWWAAELAKACVKTEEEGDRPDMWAIIVKLKECLDMEVKKNSGNSRAGSTSNGIMSPMAPGSLTMAPEVR